MFGRRTFPNYQLMQHRGPARDTRGYKHMAKKTRNVITEYRSYYLPMHFPVLLLSGDYWKISDIPSGRLHFHNCLEIGVCHSDSGTMEFYGEPLTFHEGDVTIIPKNVPHTTYSTPGTESHWSYLYFDPEELFKGILPGAWKNIDLSVYAFRGYKHILSREEYPGVYYLMQNIIRELEEQRPSYQISAKGLILSLYIELYRIQSMENASGSSYTGGGIKGGGVASDNAAVIAPALDFIEENYMQQFSIDILADLCHWSPTHFRRVFHEIIGTSPLDFLNNTRIMKSCNLLRGTEDSILDISESVGFHSVSSFNRYFIKIMQMSPREYRKQMQWSDKQAENTSILEYAGWMFPE